MEEMKLTMNGRQISFRKGDTILEAASKAAISIPTLCHLKDLTPTGACRICLVEVVGARSLVASCAAPAELGMVIQTDSDVVIKARKSIISLMLASGNHSDCMLCPVSGDCRLQELAFRYKVKSSFPETKKPYPTESVNPLIIRNFSKCILCGRCVQSCKEVQVNNAIDFGYRGSETKIVAKGDRPLKDSDCVFCGECLQACPVGAIVAKDAYFKPRLCDTEKVRTTCPYCGVGCQQTLHVNDGRIVQVSGTAGAEPNHGRLCVKGRFGYEFIYSDDRIKTPLIKKGDVFKEATWGEALDLIADKFKEIIAEDGSDALAGVSCARSINEDSYQMQKLFRGVLGTNNIDHCART